MNYRAEIDGLRALAVLPVILFHAGFEWFSGGFVGVDVFFVISGYLITSIIIFEMADGKFSIVNFYERRARRILPALFFIMLVCLPFAWIWLTPSGQFIDFGQSLIAVSTFSSNILFWRESCNNSMFPCGYFDSAAVLKPLLHTWSLAVEEQYYILFPVFLMFTWKLGLKWVLTLLACLFVISLGISHWGAFNKPVPTFYLLPTRGWELLIGVFAAFYLKHNSYFKSNLINQLLSLLGFGMVIYSIVAFDETTPFPSLYALIPTVGTGLLILSTVPNTVVHKLVSFSPIVGVGLISYSAYLWHQPVLAFARLRLFGELSDLLLIFLCSASLIMAYISWRWVEKPFRDKNRISRKAIFRFSLCGIVFFCLLGFVIQKNNGFETPYQDKGINSVNISGKVMLLGDSHANHLDEGLLKYFGDKLIVKGRGGCIPLFDIDRFDYRFPKGYCSTNMNSALNEFINDKSYEILILSHMGPVYLDNTTFRNEDVHRIINSGVVDIKDPSNKDRWDIFEKKLSETLVILSGLKDRKIVYVIDVPELGFDRSDCTFKIDRYFLGQNFRVYENKQVKKLCVNKREEIDKRVRRFHNLLSETFIQHPNIIVINPTSLFCDQSTCYGFRDDQNLYSDGHHLSEFGSTMVADLIIKNLNLAN